MRSFTTEEEQDVSGLGIMQKTKKQHQKQNKNVEHIGELTDEQVGACL